MICRTAGHGTSESEALGFPTSRLTGRYVENREFYSSDRSWPATRRSHRSGLLDVSEHAHGHMVRSGRERAHAIQGLRYWLDYSTAERISDLARNGPATCKTSAHLLYLGCGGRHLSPTASEREAPFHASHRGRRVASTLLRRSLVVFSRAFTGVIGRSPGRFGDRLRRFSGSEPDGASRPR